MVLFWLCLESNVNFEYCGLYLVILLLRWRVVGVPSSFEVTVMSFAPAGTAVKPSKVEVAGAKEEQCG